METPTWMRVNLQRTSTAAVLSGLLAAPLLAAPARTAPTAKPLPRLVTKDGRHALLVDDAPFLVLGAQCHNSSAWPALLPKVWPAVEYLKANTLEAPVYWEQFEPSPGRFDTSVVDTLVRQAREHHLRLVLLWFGTWKNGSSHYVPLWMKRQPERYPRLVGKGGRRVDSPSPHAQATIEADSPPAAASPANEAPTRARRHIRMAPATPNARLRQTLPILPIAIPSDFLGTINFFVVFDRYRICGIVRTFRVFSPPPRFAMSASSLSSPVDSHPDTMRVMVAAVVAQQAVLDEREATLRQREQSISEQERQLGERLAGHGHVAGGDAIPVLLHDLDQLVMRQRLDRPAATCDRLCRDQRVDDRFLRGVAVKTLGAAVGLLPSPKQSNGDDQHQNNHPGVLLRVQSDGQHEHRNCRQLRAQVIEQIRELRYYVRDQKHHHH